MKQVFLVILALIVIALIVQFGMTKPTDMPATTDSVEEVTAEQSNQTNNSNQSVVQGSKNSTTTETTSSESMSSLPDIIKSTQLTKTSSGLEYAVIKEGNGDTVKSGDTVTVHYTGTLEDGTVFDSSIPRGEPASFPVGVGMLIKGWDEGIPGMKVGEKRVLRIPGNLAYGTTPPPGSPIKANSTLLFEVEVLATKSR